MATYNTRSHTVDAAHSSWAARSYTSYHAQRISVAIHTRSASEILRNLVRAHTAAARGAASSRGAKRVRVTPGTRLIPRRGCRASARSRLNGCAACVFSPTRTDT